MEGRNRQSREYYLSLKWKIILLVSVVTSQWTAPWASEQPFTSGSRGRQGSMIKRTGFIGGLRSI